MLFVAFSSSVYTVEPASAAIVTSYKVVVIESPRNETYVSRFLTLTVTFPCSALHYTLTYSVDGKEEGPLPWEVENPNEVHVVYKAVGSVLLSQLPDGSHYVTAKIVCALHNYGGKPSGPFTETSPGSGNYEATWTDKVYFTIYSNEPYEPQLEQHQPQVSVDSTPPEISDLSLENQTYLSGDVPLNFTVNENAARSAYSIDGDDNITIAGNATLNGLASGAHNITVYSWDDAGNVGASKTVSFNVSEMASATPEQPENILTSLLVAAPLATVAAFIAGIVVYSKKRKNLDKPS